MTLPSQRLLPSSNIALLMTLSPSGVPTLMPAFSTVAVMVPRESKSSTNRNVHTT